MCFLFRICVRDTEDNIQKVIWGHGWKTLYASLDFILCGRMPLKTFFFLKSSLWRKKWQPTPVFLRGKVHGQRSLEGCSPWGYMTEHVCTRVEGDGLVAIKW